MKRILLHIISLVLFSVPLIIKGQLSTYVTDISLPTSIAFQGDSLYVCEYGSAEHGQSLLPTRGKIVLKCAQFY